MAKHNDFKKQDNKSKRFKEPDPPPINYGTHRPIFSFRHMRYGKAYCLSGCTPDDKADIVTTLLKLSQQIWNDILSPYTNSFGFEHIPVRQFNPTALPDIVTPDVRSLMVFAYSHGGRMAGIRKDDVYHVLLVGDDIYPHKA